MQRTSLYLILELVNVDKLKFTIANESLWERLSDDKRNNYVEGST